MFFVINPVSGSKSSEKIFKTDILPRLLKEKIEYTKLITESTNHVYTIVQTYFDQSTHVIAIISGDGTIFQVVNSLSKTNLPTPLMIFPGGTDNGIYTSLLSATNSDSLHQYIDTCLSAYSRQQTRNMNCLNVKLTKNDENLISMLSVSFGILTDIDLMSKYPRSLTIPFSAIKLIIKNPYKNDKYTICYKPVHPERPLKPHFENFKTDSQQEGSDLPDGWETLVGNFAAVIVSAHPYVAKVCCLQPDFSSFSGNALLFMMSADSAMDKLKFLIDSKNPNMSSFNYIEVVEVMGFRIFPPKRVEQFSIDGEVFDSQPVYGDCSSHSIYI